MSSISSGDIISILKSEIENFDFDTRDKEVGTVIWVGDGIVTIYGIDNAMYGEIVVFENGIKGMVQDIRRTEIGCILFGKDTGIKEGTKVTRTGKRAGVPVGEEFLGRIINALGAPIDGRERSKRQITCRLSRKHQVSQTDSRSMNHFRPVSCRSIPCSRSVKDSVS